MFNDKSRRFPYVNGKVDFQDTWKTYKITCQKKCFIRSRSSGFFGVCVQNNGGSFRRRDNLGNDL